MAFIGWYYFVLPSVLFQAVYFRNFASYLILYGYIILKIIDNFRRNIHEYEVENPNKIRSTYTYSWYIFMFLFSFATLGLSINETYIAYSVNPNDTLLINNFHTVIVCFVYWFRSTFLHDVIQRKVLHNTIFSSTFLCRTIAAIGEVAFMRQLLVLNADFGIADIDQILLALIIVAECFCYLAVSTKNQIFHFIENSIWTIVFSVMIPFIYYKSMYVELFLVLIYVIYMLIVDLPFYYDNWKTGKCGEIMSLYKGFLNSISYWEVEKNDSFWVNHMEYMTLNFTVVPLCSLRFAGFI